MTTHTRMVLALVAAALLARVVAALALGGSFHFLDEAIYVDTAKRLLAGDGFGVEYNRPPAYPVFLALLAGPFSANLVFLRVAQGVLAALGCALTFALARRCFGTGAAVVAAGLYAFDPLMVMGGGLLYPEGITAVLMTLTVLTVCRAARDDRLLASASAGALLGVVTQLRPVSLVALPVLALWIALTTPAARSRRLAHGVVVAAVFLVMLVPWTYRNYAVHGQLMPVATAGTRAAAAEASEVARRGLTVSLLATAWERPVALGVRIGRGIGHFFELYPTRLSTDYPAIRARMHKVDPRLPVDPSFPPGLRNAVSALSFGPELALALVGLVAAWRMRRKEAVLLVGIILSYAFGYALFVVKLRYRIPVLPALFILSGVGATMLAARFAPRRWRATITS